MQTDVGKFQDIYEQVIARVSIYTSSLLNILVGTCLVVSGFVIQTPCNIYIFIYK